MRLFYETVHAVNIQDYSQEQVDAWAPADLDAQKWADRQDTRTTLVAEQEGEIVGFAELEGVGHVDCLYCHRNYQRQGIGTILLNEIVAEASNRGADRLFTDASVTARPFLNAMGLKSSRRRK